MSEYFPDGWVVVKVAKINSTQKFYRVFGSWRGGYLDGDAWRMNSGITGCYMEKDGDYYFFTGYSGSTYRCHKDSYNRIGAYQKSVLDDYIRPASEKNYTMEVMPADTDWLNMNWRD
jgi:hypothetical protein